MPARNRRPDLGAGNGLLPRRALLRGGLLLAGAGSLGAAAADPPSAAAGRPVAGAAEGAPPPWMLEPGAPMRGYGQPSPHAQRVQRRVAANRSAPGNGIAWTPLELLEGMITPSGLHFERHHNGVPAIDPAVHRLQMDGAVARPRAWDLEGLLRYPQRSHLGFLECGGNSNAGWNEEPVQRPVGTIHGLVSTSEWTGVPLGLLLDEAGADPQAAWVLAEGADAFALQQSLPVAKLRQDGLLALWQNGEPIRPEQGHPMRLILPGWEGVTQVKWLRRLTVSHTPLLARNETSRYTELQPDGRARQFTWPIEVKSVLTRPSHGLDLPRHGVYQLSGLAWSGRGRIVKVEVSADGGQSWAEARLDGPVLPRCTTRFRAAWDWQGQPALLQSRATDETGAVQPSRAALIAARGRHGYFHYHAIVTWSVDEEGAVRHAYA